MRGRKSTSEKGSSPVIGTILMVAITVILAGVIGASVLGLQERTKEPGSVAGATTDGSLDAEVGFPGGTAVVAKITHISGDRVSAEDMRIHVNAPGGSAQIDPEGGCGNLDCSGMSIRDPDNVLKPTYNSEHEIPPEFAGGRTIKLAMDKANADLNKGDEVTVSVVDKDSDRVMSKNDLVF